MHEYKTIYERLPATIPMPPELQQQRVEVIVRPVKPELLGDTWPPGFLDALFGSMPELEEVDRSELPDTLDFDLVDDERSEGDNP
jgi:hypothetical protein